MKTRKSKAKAAKTIGSAAELSETQGKLVRSPAGELLVMPPPDTLLHEAEQEPNYRDLADYLQVIETLREKGFSFRDIAEWLSERGVEVDHNGVYRVYTKNMSDAQAAEETRREDEEAQAEALRNQ